MSWQKLKQKKWVQGKEGKVYILPTKQGVLFLSGIFVMILAGSTYGNNLIYLLAFLLFSVVMVSMIQTHNNLKNISLQIVNIEDSFAGEWARLDIKLSQRHRYFRQSLKLRLNQSEFFQSREALIDVLDEKESVRIEVPFLARERGVHRLSRLTLESSFPMGIFSAWAYFNLNGNSVAYVYPALKGDKKLPSTQYTASGDEQLENSFGSFQDMDFKEHRSYQIGESYRSIDWKIVARQREYYTKVFEAEVGGFYRFDYYQLANFEHELRLSQLALWVRQSLQQKSGFDLRLPEQRIVVSEVGPQFKTALRLLAMQPKRESG